MKRLLTLSIVLALLLASLTLTGCGKDSGNEAGVSVNPVSSTDTGSIDGDLPFPVEDYYFAEGNYTDEVGNEYSYLYRAPQITDKSEGAAALNKKIIADIEPVVNESQSNMSNGLSLSCTNIGWFSTGTSDIISLIITENTSFDYNSYLVYMYDRKAQAELTTEQLLEREGLTTEQFLEKVRAAAHRQFESLYCDIPVEDREASGYNEAEALIDSYIRMDNVKPYINTDGEIDVIAKVASLAGAGAYYEYLELDDSDC